MKDNYLTKYLCPACRKTFKRLVRGKGVRVCPHCDGEAVRMGQKFRPPKLQADKEWEVVLFLVENGFYFDSIPSEDDFNRYVAYPKTMDEAREFVIRHEDRAIPIEMVRARTHRIGR